MAGWMFGSSQSAAPSQQRAPSSAAEQVKPAEQKEPDLYSRTQDVAKAYKDYSKMFEPSEVVKGRPVDGASAPLRMSGYNAVPLPKGKRLLTSDDYANLVLDALKLEAQSRVTRMSAPTISGLLG
jgi:predicted ABC-class ATPase